MIVVNSKRMMVQRLGGVCLSVLMAMVVRADMFKPTIKDQLTLGKRAATEIRKKEKMLPDTDIRVATMRRIASRLLSTVKDDAKHPWEYSFDIVKSKELNAFSLPGGPVFFYSALINKFTTEDQLAAVLAHELVHVRKEHWAYSYANNQKRQLGLTVVLMVLKANQNLFDIASITDEMLITLPYSRKYENEADSMGCDMMIQAGYNPQGMVDVFETLRKAMGKGKPPEFLSDHPDDAGRIKRIQERMKKLNREFPAQRKVSFPTTD
jgi:predicted Zn-dependent protease